MRGRGESYTGVFTGWEYPGARAVGAITDPSEIAKIRRDPLCTAIQAQFTNLRAINRLPVGPRGVGYLLLGTVINGMTVVKEKPPGGDPTLISFAQINDAITTMRRANELSWADVADGRSENYGGNLAANAIDGLILAREFADGIDADLSVGQPLIEIWCEAQGLAQLVANMVGSDYGVRVYSGSGDNPTRPIRFGANRWAVATRNHKRKVFVFIIGDWDIDGLENADRLYEDSMSWFVRDKGDPKLLDIRWIAPTPAIVTEFDTDANGDDLLNVAIGTSARKPKDPTKDEIRSLSWTMQAEALLRGDVIATVLQREIEAEYNMKLLARKLKAWNKTERPKMMGALDAAIVSLGGTAPTE